MWRVFFESGIAFKILMEGNMRWYRQLFLVFIFSFPLMGWSAEKIQVAVVEFEAGTEVDIPNARIAIPELLEGELLSTDKFTPINRLHFEKILKEQQLQSSDLFDAAKTVKLGELSGAQAIVVGSVFKTGENYRIKASIISVSNGKVLESALVKFDKKEQLEAQVEILAQKLGGVSELLYSLRKDKERKARDKYGIFAGPVLSMLNMDDPGESASSLDLWFGFRYEGGIFGVHLDAAGLVEGNNMVTLGATFNIGDYFAVGPAFAYAFSKTNLEDHAVVYEGNIKSLGVEFAIKPRWNIELSVALFYIVSGTFSNNGLETADLENSFPAPGGRIVASFGINENLVAMLGYQFMQFWPTDEAAASIGGGGIDVQQILGAACWYFDF